MMWVVGNIFAAGQCLASSDFFICRNCTLIEHWVQPVRTCLLDIFKYNAVNLCSLIIQVDALVQGLTQIITFDWLLLWHSWVLQKICQLLWIILNVSHVHSYQCYFDHFHSWPLTHMLSITHYTHYYIVVIHIHIFRFVPLPFVHYFSSIFMRSFE